MWLSITAFVSVISKDIELNWVQIRSLQDTPGNFPTRWCVAFCSVSVNPVFNPFSLGYIWLLYSAIILSDCCAELRQQHPCQSLKSIMSVQLLSLTMLVILSKAVSSLSDKMCFPQNLVVWYYLFCFPLILHWLHLVSLSALVFGS